MVANWILGSLAVLSLVLLLWQWLVARRFPLHDRSAALRPGANQSVPETTGAGRRPALPGVSLLKPLKGCDAATEDCLRSWFAQEYAGEIQILFGVASADDPAGGVVRKLISEFPDRDAQLIVCNASLGANAKVSKLAELEPLAKHDVLVISDADVRVPPDFLTNAVGFLSSGTPDALEKTSSPRPSPPFGKEREGRAGLVCCFYRLANPSTLAMQWEAIAINADFWSQVLQSQSLKPLDFALGAVMITGRKQVEEIGGFEALADCLADDYQLGNRIARKGHRVVLCPVVVECWDPPMTWGAVWKHQLRWARTIRVCQPAPYFFSVISNPTLWPVLWFLIAPGKCSLTVLLVALALRIATAANLQQRLTRSWAHAKFAWLAPIKDLLQAAVWLGAFAGNTVEWRGRKFRLRRDGTLEPGGR